MPQIHNYLQIAKSIFFGLKQGIIRMRRRAIKRICRYASVGRFIFAPIFNMLAPAGNICLNGGHNSDKIAV